MTLEALTQSHQAQLSRLNAQLHREQQQAQALRLQVDGLKQGLDMGDRIITSLCTYQNLCVESDLPMEDLVS